MRVVFRAQVFRTELIELGKRLGLDLIVADDLDEFVRVLPTAEVLWITPTYYTATVPEVLRKHPGTLRWIGLTSAGYDPVLKFGYPKGAIVTNAGDAHGPLVAEHALVLLLMLIRQFPLIGRQQAEARWDQSLIPALRSIEDLTVTVVGLGSIGGQIARRLRAFGARTLGVSRSGAPSDLVDAVFPRARLHDALAQSDAVVLAVPMNDDSRHMIDAAAFAALPPHALLVNVARGAVVDSAALLAALREKRLAGAALDVTDPEPLPADSPLWAEPGVVISPHVGGLGSIAVGRRLTELFARNVAHLAAGEALEATLELPPGF